MKRFLTNVNENENNATETSEGILDHSNENEETMSSQAQEHKKPRKFSHRFNNQWLTDFPWLKRSEKKGIASCKICGVSIEGSSTHLKRHALSEKHKNNSKKAQYSRRIDDLFENKEKRLHLERVYSAELKLTMFLHEHNLPFSTMEHLPKLLRSCDPDSQVFKDVSCSRTKSTVLTDECLAVEARQMLLNDLGASGGFYSLIIDETTDTSTKKSLAMVIRFYHKTVQDRFLGLVEVKSATAEALFNSIQDLLTINNIPLEKMLGFAADNAATMMGRINGIQAKFKEKNENIMVLGCVCHSLHLCSSAAALKLPKSIEEFVRSLYNHFSNSPKRIQNFEEFQRFVNMKPYKMLKPSQTRWLSLQAVVDRVLLLWNPLNLYFTDIVSEGTKEDLRDAQVILDQLRNPVYKTYLLFLSYILPMVNKMNLQFQSETSQIHLLYKRFSGLYLTILRNYIKDEVFSKYELSKDTPQAFKQYDLAKINPSNPDYFIDIEKMYIGANAELYIKENIISREELNKMKINILNFYVELCCQIRRRFNFGDKKLEFLGHFEPKIVSSGTIRSISDAVLHFKTLVDDIEGLNAEWRELPNYYSIKDWESDNFDTFWTKVFQIKNDLEQEMFPNVNKLVKGIMCLPHSSASAERIFSQLNLVKTDLRNRLGIGTCESILFTKDLLNNANCFDWQPSASLLQRKPKYSNS